MKVRVCPDCRKSNLENVYNCIDCGATLSINTLMDTESEQFLKLKPIANLAESNETSNNQASQNNEESKIIINCEKCGQKLRIPLRGKSLRVTCPICHYEFNYEFVEADVVDGSTEKKFPIPQPNTPNEKTSSANLKSTKADELYGKGMDSFLKIFGESDKGAVSGHLTRAQGYLTMAYKAAGENIKDKKGIAGLMALILTYMDDCKNAETWAKAELSINPTNVFARLASYFIELDKFVGHKGFVTKGDGSGFGIFASILTTGVDVARIQSKKNTVKTAAIEAAKAIENKARTDPEPNPVAWLLWSSILLSIIENMWANKMKEPYLCDVLLSLPWNRFTEEQIKDLQEPIEEIEVEVHSYLGRLK